MKKSTSKQGNCRSHFAYTVYYHHPLSQPIPSAANVAGKIPSVRRAVHSHHPPGSDGMVHSTAA